LSCVQIHIFCERSIVSGVICLLSHNVKLYCYWVRQLPRERFPRECRCLRNNNPSSSTTADETFGNKFLKHISLVLMAGRDYTSDKGIATILIIIINFVYLNSALISNQIQWACQSRSLSE